MNLKSLGYRTDLAMLEPDSLFQDLGDCLAVRTPSNPTYYWGNFMLFGEPPAEGDLERWEDRFARHIGVPPAMSHVAFGWDGVDGELGAVEAFLDAGYQLNQSVVLTARAVKPPPRENMEVQIRPLLTDSDWAAALASKIECRPPEHDLAGYSTFAARQSASYRAMTRAGCGTWMGAWIGGRLVADLGVFVKDDLGRFQSVGTHPDFRRRGICATLVWHAARHAFKELGAHTLVMVADEHYHAARIYESVGFVARERQAGLQRAPAAPP